MVGTRLCLVHWKTRVSISGGWTGVSHHHHRGANHDISHGMHGIIEQGEDWIDLPGVNPTWWLSTFAFAALRVLHARYRSCYLAAVQCSIVLFFRLCLLYQSKSL